MALKRVTLVSFAFAGAIAGLAGISYVRPLNTAFSVSHDTQCRLTVVDGNLRLFWLRAEFMASYIGETPLDAYGSTWDDVQTYYFRWEQRKVRLIDRTLIDRFEIGCTLHAPLIFLLLVLLVVRPALKHPRRVWLILGELWHSSNRQGSTAWRWCRRTVLASLTCGAMVTALVLAISYHGIPDSIRRAIESRAMSIIPYDRGVTLVGVGTEPFLEHSLLVTLTDGTITFAYRSRVPKGTVVPTRDMELAGFGWNQPIHAPYHMCGWAATGLTAKQRRTIDTTEAYSLRVWFPLWVPFALCSIWPVLAFSRGPWRRSGRRIKGFCLGCGYNLTGLVEPRCPECGRPTPPGQIPSPLPATAPS